jgi:urease subunit gamma/beta
MHLSPTEHARLTVFTAAQLARRTRDDGHLLNVPEAIAIATDEMHRAARGGASFDEVLAAGRASVKPAELLDGVAGLIGEIRVEVLLGDGTRLIVLRGLADAGQAGELSGAAPAVGDLTINDGMRAFELEVTNRSSRPVRVSSHYPFDRVNPRLSFDRARAAHARLDIPAGDTIRWAPGERRVVRLVTMPASPGSA